jgi:hypothetical protein
MNTFYEHHKDNMKFGYRCFDRILLNGLIQPFQQPDRVIGSFNAYRDAERITRKIYAILLSNLAIGLRIIYFKIAHRVEWEREHV